MNWAGCGGQKGVLGETLEANLANSPLVGEIIFANNGAMQMTTTKTYDNLNRLTGIVNGNGTIPAVDSRNYAYNSANQRPNVSEVNGSHWVYGRDSLGQVTSGVKYWSDGTWVAGRQFRYAFDTIGNRKSIQAGGDAGGMNLRSANYTNAANCFRTVLSLESDTETAKDASEQLALVEQSLKGGRRRTLKEYTLRQQGLSLRYPDDWLALTPEEVQKKARGNNVLTPGCALVISNPDNWGQNVTIQITQWPGQNYMSPQDLESRVPGLKENLEKHLDGFKEVSHKIIEVAEVPALEFDCSSIGWGKRQRQRSVVFVKGQRLFTITCTAVEAEFTDAEAKGFQFVIDTLNIESPQP